MRLKRRTSRAGRTTFATLLFCGVLVLSGGLLLSAKAQAQSPIGRRVEAASYGPVSLEQTDLDLAAPAPLLRVGLLLPAVQKIREAAARIHIVNGDLEMMIPIEGAQKARSEGRFSIFATRASSTAGWVLHVKNLKTGEEITKATSSPDVTVRILPAVQSDGRINESISSSATLNGFLPAVQADGSIRAVPFRDALPASIIAILIG